MFHIIGYCTAGNLEGTNVRINGRKASKIFLYYYFRMCACEMTRPLVWQVHVHVSIMSSFLIESIVREYHVYKDVWDAVGEEFLCKREDGNRVDSFAVAVAKFKFRM